MLRAVAALVLLSIPARAINVTSTADSGAGTLREGVTTANGAPGTTLSWTIGGTLSLLSDLPGIGANTTIDFSGSGAPVTIASLPGNVPLAGAVTFQVGAQDATISASITSSGSLIKTGAGLLDLTTANSYSGGTTITAGTLRIENVSGLGSGALTFNGGTLALNVSSVTLSAGVTMTAGGTIDTLGNYVMLPGVLSGAGALTVTSTGYLFLTGANTNSGGITVNGGATVSANQDAALGTGVLTLGAVGAGTLRWGAAFDSARNITLGAGAGGTIDTNGFNPTLSGVISGTSLTKKGAGTLTLTGANTYSGGTIVNAGTLALGANNVLGTGLVTVNSGATLDMRSFTQTLGNFTGGGTVSLQQGQTSLAVTGAATLTGTTLVVNLPAQAAKAAAANYNFTPITFTGARTGTFGSIVSPAAISFTPTYNANDVTLTAAFVPFAAIAANGNQAAVGRVLEPLRTAPSGDMATVLGELYSLDAAGVQSALDRIGPGALGAISGLGAAQSSVQSAAVSRRMAALADGSAGGEFASYAVSPRSTTPGALLAEAPGDSPDPRPADKGPRSPWGFFTAAVVTTGRQNEASGDAGTQPGYAFNTQGLTLGADYRFAEGWAAGLAAGFLRGHASLYSPASGTIDDKSVRYGAYVTRAGEKFHADLYVGGASDWFTTRRGIVFGNVNRTATGSPKGMEFNVHPAVSYDIRAFERSTFSPFAALNYNRLDVKSFSETGADSLNLSVGKQTMESLQSTLGLKYSQRYEGEKFVYTPSGTLGWRHEYDPQNRPIDAQFVSGGTQFTVASGNVARDGTLIGVGLAVDLSKNLVVKFDYAGDFRAHYQDSMMNLSGRLRF